MSSSPQEVSVKAHMELTQVVSYLEALIASLNDGKVYIEQGSNVIALTPTDSVDVEIEATEKKGKQKFSLELVWRKKSSSPQDVGLKISSTKPVVEEVEATDMAEDRETSESVSEE